MVGSIDQHQLLLWIGLAFCLWVGLSGLIGWLRIPNAALVAAPLSWIIAGLFIWALPVVLHEIEWWLSAVRHSSF